MGGTCESSTTTCPQEGKRDFEEQVSVHHSSSTGLDLAWRHTPELALQVENVILPVHGLHELFPRKQPAQKR